MRHKMDEFISKDYLRKVRRKLRRMKPKPPKERLTEFLPRLYVTEDEYAELEHDAKAEGVPMGRMIRDRIREGLDNEVKWREDNPRFKPVSDEQLDELRDKGKELRDLFNNYERTGEMDMDEQARILDEMSKSVKAIGDAYAAALAEMDAEDEQG